MGGGDLTKVPEPPALRQALLTRNLGASMQLCSDLFDAGPAYKFGYDCASDLADWCIHSKKVFSISASLGEMLLATDLPDFTAEGIKFVAQAFIVRLETPIKSSTGREHDFILCSYCPNSGALSIRSYPKTYESYKPFDEATKTRVEKDQRNRNPGFQRFLDQFTHKTRSRFVVGYTCILTSTTSIKDAILQAAPPNEKDDWEIIFQLALGMNLYLQSAREKDREKFTELSDRNPVLADRKPIIHGAQLFELSVSTAFTRSGSEQSSNDEDQPGSVRPHFRRGYWRRPSGSGNDPTAFATIWVRPTWVRKDKIEKGEAPVGSLQSVPET